MQLRHFLSPSLIPRLFINETFFKRYEKWISFTPKSHWSSFKLSQMLLMRLMKFQIVNFSHTGALSQWPFTQVVEPPYFLSDDRWDIGFDNLGDHFHLKHPFPIAKAYQPGAEYISLWNITFFSLNVGKTRQADQKAISLSVSVSHCHRWVCVGHNLWQVSTESAARRALVKRFHGAQGTRPTVGGHLCLLLTWQLILSQDLILNSGHH